MENEENTLSVYRTVRDRYGKKYKVYSARFKDIQTVTDFTTKYDPECFALYVMAPVVDEDGEVEQLPDGRINFGNGFAEDVLEIVELALDYRETKEQINEWLDIELAQEIVHLLLGMSTFKKTTIKDGEETHWRKGDNFGLLPSFNDEVIAGAKAELGQPYGGSSRRDAMEKVCTTFVQKALINAGVDEDTVNKLTAVATNWSAGAGSAFHSYAEVKSGAYVAKPGDIGLVNTDGNGKAGHVLLIGENGEGYYAAAGPGRSSAYYGTNWETAFASSGIEGVISVNELNGRPYTASVRGSRKECCRAMSFSFTSLPKVLTGVAKSVYEFKDKKGHMMAKIVFATPYGNFDGIVFASAWKKEKFYDKYKGWQKGISVVQEMKYEFVRSEKGVIVDARLVS